MVPSRTSYDVVVVGARVAGAATARLLAEAGLDVLVVDRTRLPADTVSTHALMLGGVVQLRRWGLLDAVAATGAPAIDAVDITAGDISFTARVKDIGGVDRLYAPRRITLDALLARAAVEAGAELRDGLTVAGVERDDNGRVTGVGGMTHDGKSWQVHARWVVGADGIRSTVAQLVAAPVLHWAEPTNSCHYAYFGGLTGTHYDWAFAPRSGAGAIPTDGGLTVVFANAPAGDVREVRRDLEAGFHRLVRETSPALADRLEGATRVTGFRGVRGLPSFFRKPTGPGWLLVGDAGYHRDPYSAHGITDAFRDAELAARAIVATVRGDATEAAAMDGYGELRDEFATPFAAATARLASYELDISQILDVLSEMGDIGEREARFLADLPAGLGAARAA